LTFHAVSHTSEVSQPGDLTQVLRLIKVTTVSRNQHCARNRQRHGVVKLVKQMVGKADKQFKGAGVGRGGCSPGDVKGGQVVNLALCAVWFEA